MKNQEILNTKSVYNFPSLPTNLDMTESDNNSNGYGHPKTAARPKIQQKAVNGFRFGSRIKFISRIELEEKLG
jgi:hypothetical protein